MRKRWSRRKIKARQAVVRFRCRCAKLIWPFVNANAPATFTARRDVTITMGPIEIPDDWEAPMCLNRGDSVTIEMPLQIEGGVVHQCVIIPADGKPIVVS